MCDVDKISVIIPVYNVEKYVEKSVRSVMDQTYRNLEIICVNDGSTDGSLQILESLAGEDSRIVVLNKDNGGLGDARNYGMARATGYWIAFVDSDDTLRQDAYEIASQGFCHKPDMIHFKINVVSESGEKIPENTEYYYTVKYSGLVEINDDVIRKSDVSVSNKLFRKDILDRCGIRFEKIYYEDFSFTLKYMFSIRNVYCIKDGLYNYLRRSGSIMSDTFNHTPRAIDHLKSYMFLCDYLSSNDLICGNESVLSDLFVSCYEFSIKYVVRDKIDDTVALGLSIFNRYDFLHAFLKKKVMNRTVLICSKKKKHVVSWLLQKIFTVQVEFIDYSRYKVVRLFNIIIYRKPVLK